MEPLDQLEPQEETRVLMGQTVVLATSYLIVEWVQAHPSGVFADTCHYGIQVQPILASLLMAEETVSILPSPNSGGTTITRPLLRDGGAKLFYHLVDTCVPRGHT